MRSQTSMEYIILLSIILLATAAYIAYSSEASQKTTADITLGNARNQIKGLADSVCASGIGAKDTIRVMWPTLYNVTFINNSFSLRYRYKSGITDYEATTNCNVNGSLPLYQGTYYISATHRTDDLVQIENYNATPIPDT